MSPDPGAGPTLRLVQISDTHYPAHAGTLLRGVDADAGLAAVLRHPLMREHAPDLVIHTGDLIQKEVSDQAGERERCALRSYARLSCALAETGHTFHCLPGNHDDHTIMKRALGSGPLLLHKHIVRGAWQIVMLDSSIPDMPGGHLSADELELLDQKLLANPEHAIVCMHHAPVSISSHWLDTMTIDNAEDLFALMDKHSHFRAVVFGHVHQEFESRRRSVAIVGAPSTSLQFTPGEAEPMLDPVGPGLRLFELAPDGSFCTTVHRAKVGRAKGAA